PKLKYYSAAGDVEIEYDSATNHARLTIYVDGSPYDASIIVRKEKNSPAAYHYLHRAYLGSILAITNSAGNIVEKRHFDAWGNVMFMQNGQNQSLLKLTFLDRGYTGHEHLQGVGLINMNARLYDPKLHRFLAPDNFIQDPSNSQNYNRYGYVWNNPLRYNDPSGEVVWAVAIGAAVGVIMNGINNSSHGQPFFQGVIKAAGIGGISGALSFGAGSAVLGIGGSVLQQAGTGILLHGASAGMMSGMSTGDFWSGFVVGGVSSGVASGIGATGISNQYWMAGAQIGGSTIVGGASSVLAGGNFWDGARQGFITAALNHVAHEIKTVNKVNRNLRKIGIDPKSIPSYNRETVYDLISKDQTLSDMYKDAENPEIRVGGNYGKGYGAITKGSITTKEVIYIGINKSSFKNYYKL